MSPTELAAVLGHARERTEALLEPLSDEQLARQVSPLQSPLVWDLAHIGYFEELWLLRRAGEREPLSPEYDHLYDSFAHGRAERGELPILEPEAARAYLTHVRETVLALLPELDDFLVGMVAQHELQHSETMAQTLVLAGLPGPPPHGPPEVGASGDVIVDGGPFTRGSDEAWAYDNERPEHVVDLPPFRVDRALVTNPEYAEFMEAEGAPAPLHWNGNADAAPHEPVQHVSFHQAEAYARWAGKRLLDRSRVGEGRQDRRRRARARRRSGLAMDVVLLPGVSGLPRLSLRRVLGGVLRRGLPGLARRLVGDRPARRPADVPELGLPQRRQIFSGIRCASDV